MNKPRKKTQICNRPRSPKKNGHSPLSARQGVAFQRRTRKIFVYALVIGAFLFLIGGYYQRPYAERIISIESGLTAKEIAFLLKEEHLISSPYLFICYTRLAGASAKIRPGAYCLNSSMGFPVILAKLVAGETYGVRITVPEGYSSWQIARLFAEKRLANEREFLQIVREKNLEGYLFPATYSIIPGTPTGTIIQRMVEKFNRVFTKEYLQQAQKLNMNQHQILTLASIIEREAKAKEEKPLISAVFHNRLQKHWLLESCATVQYALKATKNKLIFNDLKTKSPYNTYLHPGLPPGPLCNPGESSIRAALYPEKSDKLFFVSRGNGTHVFSRYYQEHLREKQKLKTVY